MKVLKRILGKWLDTGNAEFIKAGNKKRVSYEMVVEWAMKALKHVATDEGILDGLHQCGYIE